MTCFLKHNCSHLHLFMCLEVFSNNSGLKVYNVKTELLAVGRQCLEHTEFTHTVWLTIKIFGVYFDYHNPSGMKANFDSIFKSLKKKINSKYVEMQRSNITRKISVSSKIYEQSSINHNF